MRALHTIDSLDPETGGPAVSVPELCRALARRGVDVAIWAKRGHASANVDGVRLFDGPLEHACDAFGPTVLHDHGVWMPSNHAVAVLARSRRLPRVVSPRGMLMPWSLRHRALKKRAAWWLYQKRDLMTAAALHATGSPEADQFRSLGFRGTILLAPNGVSMPSEFSRSAAEVAPTRTALFLGRIHPKKGLPLLLSAWNAVRPENWRMQVIGPDRDGHRTQLERRAAAFGIAETWSFHDHVSNDEKWQHLRRAQLVILPTYSENFAMVVAEALSAGVPVLTTTGTPWNGLVEHRCGWFVEPDEAALERALRDATSLSADVLVEMGLRGRAWMRREFGWDSVAERVVGGYGDVLGRAA